MKFYWRSLYFLPFILGGCSTTVADVTMQHSATGTEQTLTRPPMCMQSRPGKTLPLCEPWQTAVEDMFEFAADGCCDGEECLPAPQSCIPGYVSIGFGLGPDCVLTPDARAGYDVAADGTVSCGCQEFELQDVDNGEGTCEPGYRQNPDVGGCFWCGCPSGTKPLLLDRLAENECPARPDAVVSQLKPEKGTCFYCVPTEPTWSHESYIKASNTMNHARFGHVVALSADGNMLAVGSPFESNSNEEEADGSLPQSGAVYVYVRQADVWRFSDYLKPSNAAPFDEFGSSVSMSDDGKTLVVGAPEANAGKGAAYVFTLSTVGWTEQKILTASNAEPGDRFGESVGIDAQARTIVVGARAEDSNAVGIDNDSMDNSLVDSGAAYVFVESSIGWLQNAYLKSTAPRTSGEFGSSVAVSGDGRTVVVGAPGEEGGIAYVYGLGDFAWLTDDSFACGEGSRCGASVAITHDGRRVAVAGPMYENRGAVLIFDRMYPSGWWTRMKVTASNGEYLDSFGQSVSFNRTGSMLLVGAPYEDSASTDLNIDLHDNSMPSAGAAYLFDLQADSPRLQTYVKAINTNAYDLFGVSVALSEDGNTLAAGAMLEDSKAERVNGNHPIDNSKRDSGAAYVYSRQ